MPRVKSALGSPFAADAHVAGGDADDLALVVDQHLGGREARIDLDAELLGLRGRDSGRRCRASRRSCRGCSSASAWPRWAGARRLRGRGTGTRPRSTSVFSGRVRVLAPVGQQPVEADRVDHRAGEDVGADLGALLDDDDRDLARLPRPRAASGGSRWQSPAGPAPTTTTSKSIASRGGIPHWRPCGPTQRRPAPVQPAPVPLHRSLNPERR